MSRKSKRRRAAKAHLKGGLGGVPQSPLIPESARPIEHPAAQVDKRTPGKDLRLINSAVSRGWLIRPAAMSALPDAMLRIALDGQTEVRARVNAARVIVSMHGQNEPQPQSTVNVGLQVNAADAVKAALNEPDYIRFVHARRSALPGDVRPNSDGGALQAGGSHSADSGGNNGHHSGTNGIHVAH